jgi:hypothetical protein
MKNIIFLFFLLALTINSFGQMPFSTYIKPTSNSIQKKYIQKNGMPVTSLNDIQISLMQIQRDNLQSRMGILKDPEKPKVQSEIDGLNKSIEFLRESNKNLIAALIDKELIKIGKPDFLDHMNANIVTIQNGKKMFPAINGEVINYKLSLWTTKPKKGDTIPKRHYLPISLFTKISGNYSDSAAGPSDDAVSYFGAPLTLRFSPSYKLFANKYGDNALFIGVNADMRLLTIGDTIKNKLQTTWGVYGSLGLSYMGTGYGYDGIDDTDAANRHDGTWSFTAMVYFFKSGGEYNKAVFGNYDKKTLSGIELLLRFKTSKKEDAKLNFLIGASNCFTKGVPNSGIWQFRLGIGS